MISALFALPGEANARVIYVNQNAPLSSRRDGTSWVNAFTDLNTAISNANPTASSPVEIRVAKGVYKPTTDITDTNRDASFVMKSDLTIVGGYDGTGSSSPNNFTILSGDIGLPESTSFTALDTLLGNTPFPVDLTDAGFRDNCYNVVTCVGIKNVVLKNLIIMGGCADKLKSDGSVYTTLELEAMTLPAIPTDSTPPYQIVPSLSPIPLQPNTNQPLVYRGETILPLDRGVAGGGLFVSSSYDRAASESTLSLEGCTFIHNFAAYGGGLAARDANLMGTDTRFVDNYAGMEGGGYWGRDHVFSFESSIFRRNYAAGFGGGIYVGTLPSLNNLWPFLSDAEAEQFFSLSRSGVAHYLNHNLAAIKPSVRLGVASTNTGFAATLKSLSTVARPPSVQSQTASGYAYLGNSMANVNLDVLAQQLSENNTNQLAAWRHFVEGLKTYSSSYGWSSDLVSALVKRALLKDSGLEQKTHVVKDWKMRVSNDSSGSPLFNCVFDGNTAGVAGGALCCIYDNLQAEDSTFTNNFAEANGGAIFQGGWNVPVLMSCGFAGNGSTDGEGAIASVFNCRPFIVNCTLVDNYSRSTNGYSFGSELGAEPRVANSIFWGNTNALPTNALGGADIMTATKAILAQDSAAVNRYNAAKHFYVDWISLCDLNHNTIQSLDRLPVGKDEINLFFGSNLAEVPLDTTSFAGYTFRSKINYVDTYKDPNDIPEVQEILSNFELAEDTGLFEYLGIINRGEGNRPADFKTAVGNISLDPQLNGFVPDFTSPVIDAGNNVRIDNDLFYSLTGEDMLQAPRQDGERVDMGCVEAQTGRTPNVIFVKANAPGSDNSGSSWANAKTNLQEALAAGVTVYVAAGTYKPTSDGNRSAYFEIKNGSKVFGGFDPEAGITNLAQRDFVAHQAVLSGDIGVAGDDSDNSYVLLAAYRVDGPAGASDGTLQRQPSLLDGLVFTKARGRAGSSGAAIYAYESKFEIHNCTFLDNHAEESGAAIYSTGYHYGPVLSNCVFIANSSEKFGGALHYDDYLSARNCRFEDNQAVQGGGAVSCQNEYAYFWNSLFVNNSVVNPSGSAIGGAIECSTGNLIVKNCTFAQNSATLQVTQSRGGGAIYFTPLDNTRYFMAENCIFWKNRTTNTAFAAASLERQQADWYPPTSSRAYLKKSIIEGVQPPAPYQPDPQNIDLDPQFVDARGGNFRLLSYSPAIDAGNDLTGLGYPTIDLDGLPRLANATMDLGAYEFQGPVLGISADLQLTRECSSNGPIIHLAYVGTNDPGLSFQWELNRNDGAGFLPLSNNGLYSGTTSSNLMITSPGIDMNGYRYRVRASGSFVVTSGSAYLFVNPSRYYVNAAATGKETGRDWANAFRTLSQAQDAIMDIYDTNLVCAQVWVAAGTYFPTSDGDTNKYLRMRSNVAMYGGFNGTETNLNQRNWRTNPTVVSGNLGVPSSTADNSLLLFWANGCDDTAILDGFILRDAQYSALDISAATPTIRNCDFINNTGGFGAAVNSSTAAPTFENCRFTDNVCGTGCFYSQDATNVLVNSLFARNYGTYLGAAISGSRSTFLLQNCTIADNFAASAGGGIYAQQGNYLLKNCIIWGNTDGGGNSNLYRAQLDNEGNAALFQISNSIVQALPLPDAPGNLALNPLFEISGTNSYHLTAHSPAIDGGGTNSLTPMTVDLDGLPRLAGSSIDCGAYEFQGTAGTVAQLFTLPQPVTTCVGAGAITFSVSGPSNAAIIYDWQASSGSGFVTVSNDATYAITASSSNSTLTIAAPTLALNGTLYRISIRNTDYVTPAAGLAIYPPSVLYVRMGAAGANDGSSWANAFTNLQDALEIATGCNEIWVAQGTYVARASAGETSYRLRSGVPIYGGFGGTETQRSERNWTNHPTVLMASANSVVFAGRGDLAKLDSDSIVDGFTLRSTNIVPVMNLFQASPAIRNCLFDGPTGSALANVLSSPTVSNCVFLTARSTAVFNTGSSPQFVDCVFAGNTNASVGGAIANISSSPTINRCRFETNSSPDGSAIYNSGQSSPLVSRTVFFGNRGNSSGAVANNSTGVVQFKNCLFAENQSDNSAAAISQITGDLRLLNCTIANNRGARGGALFVFGGEVTSVNSIFWKNSVQDRTFIPNREMEQVELISGVQTTALHVTNSCIDGLNAFVSNGNFGNDPLFMDASLRDFQLQSASPAVNVGNNAAASALTTDLAGNSRVFGGIVDVGAYELQSAGGPIVRFLSLPAAQSACSGESATFTAVLASGETNVCQWQFSAGGAFSAVPNDSTYHVALSNGVSTLTISNVNATMNGYAFRIYVASANYVSPPVALNVSLPTVIYVKANASGGNDGTSWSAAFTNLQSALGNADNCSEIWVAQGTYPATQAADGVKYFAMKPGLEIYGGFQGNEVARSNRNPSLYKSILTGNQDAIAVVVSRGIDWTLDIDATSVLDGFVIEPVNGNAIFNYRASPAIRNCAIQNANGAGIYNEVASPTISNCVFTNNHSGALLNRNGSLPNISNSLFVNNQNPLVGGGAIANLYESHATITGCVFTNNTSPWGAAIYNVESSPTIRSSRFENNVATYDGGGILTTTGTPILEQLIMLGNQASRGPAIAHSGGTVNLVNSTFYNNRGTQSGALHLLSGNINVLNSILWGNTSGTPFASAEESQLSRSSGNFSVSNSCVQGLNTFAGNNNLATDPLFVSPLSGDVRVSPHSPTVNAGQNSFVTAAMTLDIAANPRVIGTNVDLGAYEVQAVESPLAIFSAPQSTNVCAGSSPSFNVSGGVAGSSYIWQVDAGGGFADAVTNSTFAINIGTNSSTLTIAQVQSDMACSIRYRVASTTFTSSSVTLQITLPAVWYVNPSATNGTGDGLSWSNAFTNLQSAQDAVDSCAELWVATGTYTFTNTFRLRSNVALYGGFAGTETNRNQRNWALHPSILTASAETDLIYNDASVTPIDSTAILDGFVISQGGNVAAAMQNVGASPTIRNCTFTSNSVYAVLNSGGNPSFLSCVFSNNPVGAIYNFECSVRVEDCLFQGNGGSNQYIGAVLNQASTATFRNSLFKDNLAQRGGAIAQILSSTSVVERCWFENNFSDSYGAAVSSQNSRLSARNSVWVNNRSAGYGGALVHFGETLELVQCTIAQNNAAYLGGGLYAQSADIQLRNSIFWNNNVSVPDQNVTLQTKQLQDDFGTLLATNCIIQGFVSLIGASNSAADPLFVNPSAEDFRPGNFSPAIDSAGISEPLAGSLDYAGQVRLFGAALDRGAFEYQAASSGTVLLSQLPASQTVCQGNPVRFDVVAASGTNDGLQWQKFSGSAFTNLTSGGSYLATAFGPTNTLLISEATLPMNGDLFRFVLPNLSYTSSVFTLQVSPATIIYVNCSNAVSGNGTSWANAVKTLTEAVALWDSCSEIWVAAGTYVQTNTAGEGISLGLQSPLRIYGGFAGNETAREQRDWNGHTTRLVPSGVAPVFDNQGNFQLIDALAVLDGLTFSGASERAIRNFAASPTIRNCTFEFNHTAIFNLQNSSPLLDGCVFRQNTNAFGGAVYNLNASPYLTNCIFTGNVSSERGAALFFAGGRPVIQQCQFLTNRSGSIGGAISMESAGELQITRSTFVGNSASDWGGALQLSGSTATLANCLFAENNVANRAGAIAVGTSQVRMNNCTVVDNHALTAGGGVVQQAGILAITNSILWGNRDNNYGGNIERAQLDYSSAPAPALANCIVEGVQSFAGNGNDKFDPLFVDREAGDFRLTQFSPAINSGLGTAVGSELIDLAGNPRVFGTTVDRGAYEFQGTPTAGSPVVLFEVPQSVSVCTGAGESAVFEIRGVTNADVVYHWLVDTGSGAGAVLTNDGVHSVATTTSSSTLTLTNFSLAMNGWKYSFYVTSSSLIVPYVSPAALLTVSAPGVLFVKANASGNNSGSDWTNAFTNLDLALQVSTRCSEIWVAQGTYLPPASGAVTMKDGVEIYGGFDGSETSREQRNWTNRITVLRGNSTTGYLINRGDLQPITQTAVLDGFTVTGTGVTSGMANLQASPTIRNCRFESNRAFAISITTDAHPQIENCVFTNNSQTAIDLRTSSSAVITNCVFASNSASGMAGALSVWNSSAILDRSQFNGNSANDGGGAILLNDGASLLARHCTFAGNSTLQQGGAILVLPGAMQASITNCLFVRDSAYNGGAIASYAPLTVVNNTIAANTAYGRGSGIFQSGNSATILNTILWSNSDTYSAFGNMELAQVEAPGATVSLKYSVLQGLSNYVGNGNVPYDPLFVDTAQNNFHLQDYYSPAANAGSNAFIAGIATDLDNNARILFGTAVDVGAYESLTSTGDPVRILKQPMSAISCDADTVSFSVVGASGMGSGFTWQQKAPAGSYVPVVIGGNYSVVTNASTSTLTIQNVSSNLDGYEFRARFLPNTGQYYTEPAQLTVNPPRVIYVNAAAQDGGDGESWGTAYNSMQMALGVAGLCRPEIWVAAGTYYPTTSTNQSDSFTIPNGVRVYGGFAGTETLLSQRNSSSNQVVLSGDIGTIGNTNDNSSYVVLFDGSVNSISQSTILDGVTVERGLNAGMLIFYASPTVRNCLVRSNNGSGLNVTSGGPRVEQCTFYSNRGTSGAYVTDAINAAFVNCRFSGNTSTSLGGGLALVNSTVGLTNCLVSGNTGSFGAGIGSSGGDVSMINCTVVANASTGSASAGLGAVSGNWFVRNSIFWGNRAGALENEAAQLTFSGTFSVGYTAIEGLSNFSGNSNQGADPVFAAPLSATLAPTTLGDYTLGTCSALLNDADPSVLAGITNDLAGNPRQTYGSPDPGAFERQLPGGDPVSITSQPVSVIYCSAQTNYFEVTAAFSNLNSLAYQWQMFDSNTAAFIPMSNSAVFSGVTLSRLGIQSPTADLNGAQFRVTVTTPVGCSAISQPAQLTVPAQQTYVRAGAPPGGNGVSWATAYTDLRSAVLSTCAPEIWVAEGTYTSTTSYTLRSGVAIYGGFAGTETSRNQRNWVAHPTKLASTDTYVIDITPSAGNPVDSSARVDGLIIDGADNALNIYGIDAPASPVFANCVFKNTRNPAIYIDSCSPSFVDCIFDNNNTLGTASSGGALTAVSCTVEIDRCVFRANRALYGGAVAGNFGAVLHIANSLFSGNQATYGGSALSVNDPFVLRSCTVTGNRSLQGYGAVSGGAVTLVNSIIWSNQAVSGLDFQAQIDVGDSLTISNTIVQSYDPDYQWWVQGSGISGQNPMFYSPVNPSSAPTSAGDLHVASCSPAIDGGLNAQTSGSFDLVGSPRSSGAATDMGAYEALPGSLLMVSLQPTNALSGGSAVNFSVAANYINVSYQWERSVSNLFTALTNGSFYLGVTTPTLTLTNPISTLNSNEFRCRITDTFGCIVYSQPAQFLFQLVLAPTNAAVTSGNLNLQFNSSPGAIFTVLGATNISLSLDKWTVFGGATEIAPGQYRFTQPVVTNRSAQFYRLRSP